MSIFHDTLKKLRGTQTQKHAETAHEKYAALAKRVAEKGWAADVVEKLSELQTQLRAADADTILGAGVARRRRGYINERMPASMKSNHGRGEVPASVIAFATDADFGALVEAYTEHAKDMALLIRDEANAEKLSAHQTKAAAFNKRKADILAKLKAEEEALKNEAAPLESERHDIDKASIRAGERVSVFPELMGRFVVEQEKPVAHLLPPCYAGKPKPVGKMFTITEAATYVQNPERFDWQPLHFESLDHIVERGEDGGVAIKGTRDVGRTQTREELDRLLQQAAAMRADLQQRIPADQLRAVAAAV